MASPPYPSVVLIVLGFSKKETQPRPAQSAHAVLQKFDPTRTRHWGEVEQSVNVFPLGSMRAHDLPSSLHKGAISLSISCSFKPGLKPFSSRSVFPSTSFRVAPSTMPFTAQSIYPTDEAPFVQFPSRRSVVHSTKGIVACSQPLAAEAGQRILKQGGNAAVRRPSVNGGAPLN